MGLFAARDMWCQLVKMGVSLLVRDMIIKYVIVKASKTFAMRSYIFASLSVLICSAWTVIKNVFVTGKYKLIWEDPFMTERN